MMRCSWDQTNIRQRKDIKENGFFVVVMFACVAWPGHDAKLRYEDHEGSDESMEDIQSEKSQKSQNSRKDGQRWSLEKVGLAGPPSTASVSRTPSNCKDTSKAVEGGPTG